MTTEPNHTGMEQERVFVLRTNCSGKILLEEDPERKGKRPSKKKKRKKEKKERVNTVWGGIKFYRVPATAYAGGRDTSGSPSENQQPGRRNPVLD